MGKSSKKFAKVDAAHTVAPPTKSAKNGKREADEVLENQASAKKQKRDVGTEQSVEKQNIESKTQKKINKKMESSSSDDAESEEEQKVKVAPKKGVILKNSRVDESSSDDFSSEEEAKKQPVAASKSGIVGASFKKGSSSSSEYSDSTDDSESDDSSSSDGDKKVALTTKGKKPAVVAIKEAKEQRVAASKNGTIGASFKKDSSTSSEDSDSSEEDEEAKEQPVAASKNGTIGASFKKDSSTSSEDSDSSEEDENPKSKVAAPSKTVPIASVKNVALAAPKKEVETTDDSDSDDSSSSDGDEKVAKMTPQVKKMPTSGSKNVHAMASMKATETSDSSEDSESDEEVAAKKVESSDGSSDSESEEDAVQDSATKVFLSKRPSVSKQKKGNLKEADSDGEEPQKKKMRAQTIITTNASKKYPKPTQNVSYSDEDSSEESGDDEPQKQLVKKPTQVSKVGGESEEEEESEPESSEEEEEQPSRTSKKNVSDVEMVDAVTPKTTQSNVADDRSSKKAHLTPVTPQDQALGSKTLFVGNLPFSVEQADVENFFKDVGEVVDIRFCSDRDGAFRGFGHVEFATAEDAQKALKLDGKYLLGRSVRLDLARERDSHTPFSGKERDSYQKGGKVQGQTIFVRGFDKSGGEEQVRSALKEHFGACGEITRLSIPREYGGDELKGIAYINFKDSDSFNKALELSGSELEGYALTVEEARPRGDTRDITGSGRGGGRSGGRDGGRFGGRGGRSGGRDSGDRFGGRGGRGHFGGGGRFRGDGRFGGGRGHGMSNKPSMGVAGTGKKTTFDD